MKKALLLSASVLLVLFVVAILFLPQILESGDVQKNIRQEILRRLPEGSELGEINIASLLMGKGRVDYAPHLDCGDSVIVINSDEVRVTGKKSEQKLYKHYTGYPSGLRQYNFEWLMKKDSTEIVRRAVRGMVPKNILGRRMMKRIRIFKNAEHLHIAQKPVPYVW